MKNWAGLLLFFLGMHAYGQSVVPVSSTGIGGIKINMTLQQVEKVIGQAIMLKPASTESYEMDTALVSYKGVQVALILYTVGGDETNKTQKKVYSVGASHPNLQTRTCKPEAALPLAAINLTS